MSRKLESNIEKLANRTYPRRNTDTLSPEVARQLCQNFVLSVLPLKDSLFAAPPPCSLLKGVPRDASVFHAEVKAFGVFTSELIPPHTDIFTIKVNDKAVDPTVRDSCTVHTSKDLISLLNPPVRSRANGRTYRSKCGADGLDCFLFHDNAYMYNPAAKVNPGKSTLSNVRHIHHFVADPCTESATDLKDQALSETNWFDVQSTALIFINGGRDTTDDTEEVVVTEPSRKKSKRALYIARACHKVIYSTL
jgi:hypothetical protein